MPPKTSAASPASKPPSFEQGLDQLEKIVNELERGELTLEESITLFEKGVALSDTCREQLEAAETRVEVLRTKGIARPAATAAENAVVAEDAMGAEFGGAENDEDIPF